jgi:hypothetical protein
MLRVVGMTLRTRFKVRKSKPNQAIAIIVIFASEQGKVNQSELVALDFAI